MADYNPIGIVNQANAFKVFFEGVLKGEEIAQASSDSIAQYHLRYSDKKKMQHVASEVSKASSIIDHLVEKYGLTQKGTIRDKKGIFKDMFDYLEKSPSDSFSVRPFHIAMGFYLDGKHFDDGTLGDTIGQWTFGSVLDDAITAIEDGTTHYGLGLLAFRVNRTENKPENPKDRLLSGIFGYNATKESTQDHELKHIIDRFILEQDCPLLESSANLFDDVYDPDKDKIAAGESAMAEKESYEEALNLSKRFAGELITSTLERKKRKFEQARAEYRRVIQFPFELFEELKLKGLSYRTQSFIVPLVPFDDLADLLREIKKAV